jgi:hypothetical protein
MIKRINREITELKKIYNNIDIIDNKITIDNKTIILTKYYPFECPKVYINEKIYNTFLLTSNIQINNILQTYFNINCLCCSSILCHNNWIAKYGIHNILNEISFVNNIKKDIKYIIFLKKIVEKYNISIYKYILYYLIDIENIKNLNFTK